MELQLFNLFLCYVIPKFEKSQVNGNGGGCQFKCNKIVVEILNIKGRKKNKKKDKRAPPQKTFQLILNNISESCPHHPQPLKEKYQKEIRGAKYQLARILCQWINQCCATPWTRSIKMCFDNSMLQHPITAQL